MPCAALVARPSAPAARPLLLTRSHSSASFLGHLTLTPQPAHIIPPQRVPVQLKCAVPKKLMACLEASSASGEVKELPLWLAKGLNTAGYVEPSFPTAYKERSLQKMKAGASSVQLGQRYPYFYHLGTEMALLDNTQKGYEVLETLQEAFAMRYKEILDRFHNTGESILVIHTPTLSAAFPLPFLML